jgi:ribosomal protein L11 methylase PrmA
LPRIIDIGCGFGDLLFYWKSRGVDAVGVDADERAVKMAHSLGLSVLKGGNGEQQNISSESFDVAVFNHSLNMYPPLMLF